MLLMLQKGWDMTHNQKLHVLHVDSAEAFAEGQVVQHVTGDTLLFDFVYFLHPVSLNPFSSAPCSSWLFAITRPVFKDSSSI